MSSSLNPQQPLPQPVEAVSDMDEAARGPMRLGVFENVNLLRAFAALSVVVYHVIAHGRWTAFPTEGPLLTFRVGFLGVDLFFVISGFVITYSALVLYRADPDRFAKRYWMRRLTRILPLYLATLLLWLVVIDRGFFTRPGIGWQLFTHLTFMHAFWPDTHGTIDGVNWTLAVEMHFYLAVALLVPWIARTPAWRIWAYGIVVACAWRAAMFLSYGHADPNLVFIRASLLPGNLDEFGAGIFLAKIVIDGRPPVRGEAFAWMALAALIGYAAMSVYWPNAGIYWDSFGMTVFWRAGIALCALCMVAAAIRLPQTLATRWLRPFNYLGEISYGIYLWHLFVVQVFIHALGWRGMPSLFAVVAVTIMLSAASWHAFEKPFMAFARR